MKKYICDMWKNNSKIEKVLMVLKGLGAVLLVVCLFLNWNTIIDRGQLSKSGIAKLGIIGIILFGSVILIFWRPDFSKRTNRILAILYAILSPIYIFLAMEVTTGCYFDPKFMRPIILILNLVIIFMIEGLFLVLTNSLRWGSVLTGIVCILFAFANALVYQFRGNPILVSDFATIGTAFDVAGNYTISLGIRSYFALLALYGFLMFGGILKETRFVKKIRYRAGFLAVLVLLMGLFANKVVLSDYLKDQRVNLRMFKLMDSYRRYGNAVTFVRSIKFASPEEPEGYSVEAVEEIAEKYPSDQAKATEDTPNIIVTINESFSDLSVLGDFETNEDYMPFIHSLKGTSVTGYTYASIVGGQTANTEFEVLTNNSMAFLPSQSVVFQLYLNEEMPSLVTSLKAQGYIGNDAMHLWNETNYRRNIVYPLLGFDHFYHKENSQAPLEYLREYTSDVCNNHNIIANYESYRAESDQPYVNYSMTMQNHGPYDTPFDNFQEQITLEGLEGNYDSEQRFLSLIKASDDAFKELTEYFAEVDEPTVILMAGDHQPKVDDKFLKEITDGEYRNWDAQESMARYQVPFVIWANYPIESQDIPKISMNYLQTLLMEVTGEPMTGYQKFLEEMRKEVPAITAFGYWGADGNFYRLEDESSPYYEWIHQYSILQYNNVKDTKNRVEDFFYLEE